MHRPLSLSPDITAEHPCGGAATGLVAVSQEHCFGLNQAPGTGGQWSKESQETLQSRGCPFVVQESQSSFVLREASLWNDHPDLAWAGSHLGASFAVFLSLNKKPKIPLHCAFLTSNLSVLKNAWLRCGAASTTSEAQQTGLLVASWCRLAFAQPTGLHWKRRWLTGAKEEQKDGTEAVSYPLGFAQVLVFQFGLTRYIKC